MIYTVTSLPQLAAVAHATAAPGRERIVGGFVTPSGKLATYTAPLDEVSSAEHIAEQFGFHLYEVGVVLFQVANPAEAIGWVAELSGYTPEGVKVGTLSGSTLALDGQLHDFDALCVELPHELRQQVTPLTVWGERRVREFDPVQTVEADPVEAVRKLVEVVALGPKPEPGLLARLAGLFGHVSTRDLVLTTALGIDPDESESERGAGWDRAMSDPDFEPDNSTTWRTALVYVAEHVSDEVAGSAWAVAAAYAWVTGGYGTAEKAVDRALDLDPEEGLAQLTRSAVRDGIHPASVKRGMGL